jgi:tetratricopeptide (TPR) repeat protein
MIKFFKKKLFNLNFFTILAALFLLLFSLSFNADFIVKEWGGIKVPFNAALETAITLKRIDYSGKILRKIENSSSELKPYLLEFYYYLIPVTQRWTKLYPYKEQSGKLLAQYYQSQERYEASENIFKSLLEFEENNYLLWDSLGQNYEFSNNQNQAIKSYLRVIELNPNYYPSIDKLARIYYSRDEIVKFIATLDFYLNTPTINKLCIYWAGQKSFNEGQKLCQPVLVDGSSHSYNILLTNYSSWKKEIEISDIRIDPIEGFFPLDLTIENLRLDVKDLKENINEKNIFYKTNTIGLRHSNSLEIENSGFRVIGSDPYMVIKFDSVEKKDSLFYIKFSLISNKTLEDDLNEKYTKAKTILSK